MCLFVVVCMRPDTPSGGAPPGCACRRRREPASHTVHASVRACAAAAVDTWQAGALEPRACHQPASTMCQHPRCRLSFALRTSLHQAVCPPACARCASWCAHRGGIQTASCQPVHAQRTPTKLTTPGAPPYHSAPTPAARHAACRLPPLPPLPPLSYALLHARALSLSPRCRCRRRCSCQNLQHPLGLGDAMQRRQRTRACGGRAPQLSQARARVERSRQRGADGDARKWAVVRLCVRAWGGVRIAGGTILARGWGLAGVKNSGGARPTRMLQRDRLLCWLLPHDRCSNAAPTLARHPRNLGRRRSFVGGSTRDARCGTPAPDAGAHPACVCDRGTGWPVWLAAATQQQRATLHLPTTLPANQPSTAAASHPAAALSACV